MESRQGAQRSLHLCLISPVFPPDSQPRSYFPEEPRHPPLHGGIADPNTKRSHTFSAGNHAEPAGTFHHLSFHFELEMGLCSVFQAAGVENTFRVPSVKSLTVISINRRHCPGIQTSRPKWKNVVSSERFWSNNTWFFEIAGWQQTLWVVWSHHLWFWDVNIFNFTFYKFDTCVAVDSKWILQ